METTRQQIYDMMWTEGIGKTEKALGLKYGELKAICDKFNIPRPSSGYWTSTRLGRPTHKTALPENDSSQINTDDYVVKKKSYDGKYPTEELPAEGNVDNIYKVPDVLHAKDSLILDTETKLREREFANENPWRAKNPFKCKTDKWLEMRVSKEQEDRAIRIYATIIKAAASKGYELKIVNDQRQYNPECTTYFIVREHEIRTYMREIFHYATKEDGSKDRYNTVGSGILKFECDKNYHHYHYRSSYDIYTVQDSKYIKLEEKIERIIETLEKIADERDEWKRECQLAEERRKRKEERKRLEEEERKRLQALKDEEYRKVQKILHNADRLRVATVMREYIHAYEIMMANQGRHEEESIQSEIEWMKRKADFIDPFVNIDDEMLTESDIDSLINPHIIKTGESKPSFGCYQSEPRYSYWQIKNMWRK